ncbi:MAG: cytochrome c [Bacteroidia bacterium]
MKKIVALLLLICSSSYMDAQTPNYSEHIAPIIYNNCTKCHREGEIAPFSLTNYTEVASWANMIQYVTEIGYMPPWKPNPDYRRFQKEKYLSAEEKQLISDWVDAGMPQGNPDLEPELPVFPEGSQVGVPDLTVSYAESYVLPGINDDVYRYFVIPTGLTEDRNIRALEFRPGNKRIVHHALIWEDTTGQSAAYDAATPEYGYSGEEGGSANLDQTTLPGYVPGAQPVVYSQGLTQRLHAGSDLKLQVHYAPSPVEETDSSSINIFFETEPANRLLQSYVMVPLPGVLTNGPFIIPANEYKEFHGTFTVPFQVSLFSIAPHCHLLGTHWKVYVEKPDGDTIPLIDLPDWDFNWQGDYQFRELVVLLQVLLFTLCGL